MLDPYRIHIPFPSKSEVMVSRTGNFLFSRCRRRGPNPLVKIQLHSHIYLPGRLENTSSRVTISPIKTGEGENKFGKTMSVLHPMEHLPTSAAWCCGLTGEGESWSLKGQSRIWEADDVVKMSRVWIRALVLVVVTPEIAIILTAAPCIHH